MGLGKIVKKIGKKVRRAFDPHASKRKRTDATAAVIAQQNQAQAASIAGVGALAASAPAPAPRAHGLVRSPTPLHYGSFPEVTPAGAAALGSDEEAVEAEDEDAVAATEAEANGNAKPAKPLAPVPGMLDSGEWSAMCTIPSNPHMPTSEDWRHDDDKDAWFRAHELPEFYKGEQYDASMFRNRALADHIYTHYMGGDEQASHEVSFRDGRLWQRGRHVDTHATEHAMTAIEAAAKHGGNLSRAAAERGSTTVTHGPTGFGTEFNAGQGKYIFVMDLDGTIRACDPYAEHKSTEKEGGGLESLGFINHSSLVAGGAVAGAGELAVADGRLTQVSDLSGHYKPDGVMFEQSLRAFEESGVDLSDVDLKFGIKHPGETPMYASTAEFRSHANPALAEAAMRARRRDLKDDLASFFKSPMGPHSKLQAKMQASYEQAESEAVVRSANIAADPEQVFADVYNREIDALSRQSGDG